MADRRSEWERERWRRQGHEAYDRGEWDDPMFRGPIPEDPRWHDERRFGPARFRERRRPPQWDDTRGSTPVQREWHPSGEDRYARPRGGTREGQRGAYTGWGYEGHEDRPHRTYWYGSEDDDQRWLESNQAGGEWRRPDRYGQARVGRGFDADPDSTTGGGDSLARFNPYRVVTGPHAGKGPRGYRRDWGRVRDDVCDVLERDGEVDASDIDVQVEEGIVTLRGTVPDRHQKRRAEQLIDGITQIRDVHNELRIHRHGTRGHGLSVNGTDHGATGETH